MKGFREVVRGYDVALGEVYLRYLDLGQLSPSYYAVNPVYERGSLMGSGNT
ncbi:MAG: hypothetical protein RXO24_12430 [Acidilobus sp.]